MDRITTLLKSLEADFPRRKMAAEELMRRHGLLESLDLEIAPPDHVADIPTFDPEVRRELTPMLQARFDHAGTMKWGMRIWLSAREIASYTKQKEVREWHRALRENWEGSAPMKFPDSQLTLFGVTEGLPENLNYLAWVAEKREPEVYIYSGMETHEFKDLEQYLTWCLERE